MSRGGGVTQLNFHSHISVVSKLGSAVFGDHELLQGDYEEQLWGSNVKYRRVFVITCLTHSITSRYNCSYLLPVKI